MINVKIDTKEKFTVFTPFDAEFPANMTDELFELINSYQEKKVPHIILNLNHIRKLDTGMGEKLAALQHEFYENNSSFIICEMQKSVEEQLDEQGLLELMNVTPTESEAWDICQMEEIERELMQDFDEPENE